MNQSRSPQMLVVPSLEPAKDADKLQKAFGRDAVIETSADESVVVESGESLDSLITIILIMSPVACPTQALVLPESCFDSLAGERCAFLDAPKSLQQVTIPPKDDASENALLLRLSVSSILLIPPAVVSTSQGRIALAGILTQPGMLDVAAAAPLNTKPSSDSASISLLGASHSGDTIMDTPRSRLPDFPTLEVGIMGQDGEIRDDFPTNSPSPVPFETDLFQGKMLLVLRPEDPNEDPYWNGKIFSKRKRRFIFQIQGKFKRKPNGVVYAGAEVTEQMKLGLVAKGLSNILLKLVGSFNSNVHYSFGDKNNEERSHIVVPAYTFFERFVVTKPGETPPTLGEPFNESKSAAAARKASKGVGDWNTEDTYSMSYYSMYIDLPHWSIVKVPVAPTIDLRTFWGKSLLRIVLYESNTPSNDKRHLHKDNGYFFCLQMKFLGHGAAKDKKNEQANEETLPWAIHTRRPSEVNLRQMQRLQSDSFREDKPYPTVVEESDGEEFFFFDAEEEDQATEPNETNELSSNRPPNLALLAKIDNVCPLWIEVISKFKYAHVFAFNFSGQTVFRSSSTALSYLNTDTIDSSAWSPRLSSSEKTRRLLGQAFLSALENESPTSKLSSFRTLPTEFDAFLRRSEPRLSSKRSSLVRKSGFMARALSDHHWVEEWVKITDLQLSFYHPERLQRANFRVSVKAISQVHKLAPKDCPSMAGFYFLAVHTQGRTVYLMFPTEQTRDGWLEHLSTVTRRQEADNNSIDGMSSISNDNLLTVDDPADEFLHKSSKWNSKQRRILNCKSFVFRAGQENVDPTAAIEDVLRRALSISDEAEESQLRAFFDSASVLKKVHVGALSEKERLSFFLNLYHVMVVHASLVLGAPDSSFKWITYFNAISYECSDDILSIAELEHCVIRAAMNYPSQFVSKLVLPKSRFSFALTRPDYRINFALNSGSYSSPAFVPIYKPATIDEQLAESARLYLQTFVRVTASKRSSVVISLPRVCQWFADDFGNSSSQVLRELQQYLTSEQQELLSACWSGREGRFNNVTIKHLNFCFECRSLTLLP